MATRYWVKGFLSGNVPRQPNLDDWDDPVMVAWQIKARDFLVTGYWPPDDDEPTNHE